MPMPIAALRDPANETPLADTVGLAGFFWIYAGAVFFTSCFGDKMLGSQVMGWRAS